MNTRSTYYVLFFLFLLGINLPIFSQNYLSSVRHYSVEEGLSGRYVNSIQEDDRGFIWITTWFGINRFDGFEFKHYLSDEYGFSHDRYSQSVIDKNGKLWFGYLPFGSVFQNLSGPQYIDIFDPIKEQVENNIAFPFEIRSVLHIKNDEDNNVWIGTDNGDLYKYDGVTFQKILSGRSFKDFLITSPKTIATFDFPSTEIQFFDQENNFLKKIRSEQTIGRVMSDGKDGILLMTYPKGEIGGTKIEFERVHPLKANEKVEFFDKKNNLIEFLTSIHSIQMVLDFDKNGNVIMFLEEGVYYFDENFRMLLDLSKDKEVSKIQNGFRNFYFDKKNNAWLSSSNGIGAFSIKKGLFTNYLVTEKLSDNRAISQSKNGDLFFNQYYTYRLDAETKKIEKIDDNNFIGTRGSIVGNDEKLYIGTYGKEVHVYDLTTQKKVSYKFEEDFRVKNKTKIGVTNVFYQSKKTGKIYIGTSKGGVFYLDEENKKILPFRRSELDMVIENMEVGGFFENEKGIWIGTNRGLFLFDEEKGFIEQYFTEHTETPNIQIYTVYEDENKDFWLSTFNDGLYRWTPSTNELLHLTTKDGLSDNTIYAVYEDDFGNLWLPSNEGLMRMNKTTFDIKTYLPADGIPHQEFNSTSHFRAKDGKFYFGGLKGITSFDPKDFQIQFSDEIPSNPSISLLKVFDASNGIWKKREVDDENFLQLNPNDNAVRIHFLAYDFFDKSKNQFAYWASSDRAEDPIYLDENILELTDFKYGNSQLFIKGRATDRDWSTGNLEISIYRRYPVYMRASYIILALLTLGSLGFFFYQKKKRKEAEDEKKLAETIKEVKESFRERSAPTETVVDMEEETIKPNSAKEEWLRVLNKKATELIDDGKFSIPELAESMNLSERQFRRKLKQGTGMLPTAYLREVRLTKAEYLLKNRVYETVSEVCHAVGFSTPKHFSKLFKKRFGRSPSTYFGDTTESEGL